MNVASAVCRLELRSAIDCDLPPIVVDAGGVATGLQEDHRYSIQVCNAGHAGRCRLLMDDVEIHPNASASHPWTPNFFAGRVTAIVVEPSGRENLFALDVSPTPKKLGLEQFQDMLDDIRAFDATLLLGASSASMGFGREGQSGGFESLVQLARLRQHGPGFLAAVRAISRLPQRFLRPASQALPLARIRRLHPSALRDHHLAALASGYAAESDALESLQLLSQTPLLTVDTPANRTLMALLRRFRAAVSRLKQKTEALALGGSPDEQTLRQARRAEVLNQLEDEANALLDAYPFNEVSKVETTAAGLTQIAAHPVYSRAYRQGTQALRLAVEGSVLEDMLQVSPSWGIYETWCFVRLLSALELITGQRFQTRQPTVATADLTVGMQLPDGSQLDILFQATFPAEAPNTGRSAWSLSRERRPDIVLLMQRGSEHRFLVLDAKYRSGRDNVLDAMASAHIYHDALRVGDKTADLCLLLLPGQAVVPSLEDSAFWNKQRVGALSGFATGGQGEDRCAQVLREWIFGRIFE
jgi:hypothetical protein